MTRIARRTTARLLTVLSTLLLTVTLFAGPALAAEEATGFGSGQWDGLVLSALVGVVLGLAVFLTSDPAGIHKSDSDH